MIDIACGISTAADSTTTPAAAPAAAPAAPSVSRISIAEFEQQLLDEYPEPVHVHSSNTEDLMHMFAVRSNDQQVEEPQHSVSVASHIRRVDAELKKWKNDTTQIDVFVDRETSMVKVDSVLDFWQKQHAEGRYELLPVAARVLFSIPASSAQIERDFGMAGEVLDCRRTNMSDHNVAMCTFLSQNKAFVDVEQCEKIDPDDLYLHVPSNYKVSFERDEVDFDVMIAELYEREIADNRE